MNSDNFIGSCGEEEKDKTPGPGQGPEHPPAAPYKKGDFIGKKYEVHGVLGRGGFGVVYLVYSHETKEVYALKTFRDEYLADAQTRERFRKEASAWVELERSPYIVRANIVDEVSGRLYIALEYIAPNEKGLNSMEGYLQRRPPDLAQSLRWAIQVCLGMEYAYAKGVRAHRDLKPANILISQDGTAKITDFGLVGVLSESSATTSIGLSLQQGRIGLSGQTLEGVGFGTPTHMPPEQFDHAADCDERSDIYAFGIVLYQMAAGGRLPFLAPLPRDASETEKIHFLRAMHRLHSEEPVPRLDSPLFPLIHRCLEKEPGKRYPSFEQLRSDLEPLLRHQTGEIIKPPQLKELEGWELNNKGMSLSSLGHDEEAIRCYDQALEFGQKWTKVWSNKGNSLDNLGRYEEALRCFDKALEIDPHNELAWDNKGGSLINLGHYEEAIRCYDQALELDPQFASAWCDKGLSLCHLGRYQEAIHCLDKSLELDPRLAQTWTIKGMTLRSLGHAEDAIFYHDKALILDPYFVNAYGNKGNCFSDLGHFEEAIQYYDKALELNPRHAAALFCKALAQQSAGALGAAIATWRQYLEVAHSIPSEKGRIAQVEQRLHEVEGM